MAGNDMDLSWSYYNAALQGEDTSKFPVTDGTAYPLYGHSHDFKRVAIYPKDGRLVATVDGKPSDPARVFADFIRPKKLGTVVSFEIFKANRDQGRPWPKQVAAAAAQKERDRIKLTTEIATLPEPSAAGYRLDQPLSEVVPAGTLAAAIHDMGHNNPPGDLDAPDPQAILELIAELTRDFEAEQIRLKGKLDSEEFFKFVSEVSLKAGELEIRAKAYHKAEKEPFLIGGRAVDDKWRTAKELPELLKKRAQAATAPYHERLRKERAAADARAAENRRLMAEGGTLPAMVENAASGAPRPLRGGVKAKTVQKVVFAEPDGLLAFATYALTKLGEPDAELRARLGVIAHKLVVAGVKNIPGIEVTEDIQFSN